MKLNNPNIRTTAKQLHTYVQPCGAIPLDQEIGRVDDKVSARRLHNIHAAKDLRPLVQTLQHRAVHLDVVAPHQRHRQVVVVDEHILGARDTRAPARHVLGDDAKGLVPRLRHDVLTGALCSYIFALVSK